VPFARVTTTTSWPTAMGGPKVVLAHRVGESVGEPKTMPHS
jgi:hypothetical protein